MVRENEDYTDFRLYWGDLHVHSGLSSCFWLWETRGGSLDEIYGFVRDEAKLDFVAVTDHGRMSDEDWAQTQAKAKEYELPRRFVTFLAYEWSSRLPYGGSEDRNIYYLKDDMPIFRGSEERSSNAWKLFSLLEKEGIEAIVVPHHSPIVGTFTDWDQHDPKFQPVVEIASGWGNFEYFRNPHYCKGNDCWPGNFYQDLLKRELKLGAIASSDAHDNRPSVHKGPNLHCVRERKGVFKQSPNPLAIKLPQIRIEGGFPLNPITPCYVGIYAKDLTREALFEALKARRVFATAGGRISVELKVDGRIMGQEYQLEETLPVKIQGKVLGEEKIRKVEVIRNNRVIYKTLGDSKCVRLGYVDEGINERVNYYYLRATQMDGRIAWSSPVWITCKDQPDLSLNIQSISQEFPKVQIEKTNGLLGSAEGLAIWTRKKEPRKNKMRILWKGNGVGQTCSGELHLKNTQNYFVHMSGFQRASDLFTDDGSGVILWNVKLTEVVKGLNIVTTSRRENESSAKIKALIDEKRVFERIFVNGKRLSITDKWITQTL